MLFASARFWLLDFFGHVVDHDPLRDCLFSVTPPPGRYPGLFFFADTVSQEQFTVTLRKAVSLPMPIPQLQATRLPSGVVTLRRLDGSGRFLRSVENAGIDFLATEARDWEHFFILSEQLMHGYAILSQPEISVITCENGEEGADTVLPPMSFAQGHLGVIGPYSFSLAANLPELENLSLLEAGQSGKLRLRTVDGSGITLDVKRA